MTKGSIVLIPFPFTDLSGKKVRPALLLKDFTKGEDCIVAFISSVPAKKPELFTIYVKPSPENGLKTPSIVKLNKLATLQRKIIIGNLGILEKKHLNEVSHTLKALFNL